VHAYGSQATAQPRLRQQSPPEEPLLPDEPEPPLLALDEPLLLVALLLDEPLDPEAPVEPEEALELPEPSPSGRQAPSTQASWGSHTTQAAPAMPQCSVEGSSQRPLALQHPAQLCGVQVAVGTGFPHAAKAPSASPKSTYRIGNETSGRPAARAAVIACAPGAVKRAGGAAARARAGHWPPVQPVRLEANAAGFSATARLL